jgi:hypothetical protein
MQRLRYLLAIYGLALLAAGSAAGQVPSSTAAPASQPASKVYKGTIKSIDTGTRQVKLLWKHPRQQAEMEFLARLGSAVQVTVDGKPATVADIHAGDRVEFLGRTESSGDRKQNIEFVVQRVQVIRKPTSAPAGVSADVDQILDRLEKKGDQVRDIQTRITYTKNDPVLEDKQVFQGILRFKQDKPNPRFFIRFDKFIQEGVTRDSKEWHVFDGQWYIEAREKTKTIVKRQVVRPGEEVNVFRLGQGPFPLPFGQKKADIEKHFAVKLIPSKPADPPNSYHLECTPKPGTDMEKKYGKIDFHIDKDLNLPVRVRTTEKSENVEVTADFPASSIEVNKGLAGSELNLPPLSDYQIDTVPLGSGEKGSEK